MRRCKLRIIIAALLLSSAVFSFSLNTYADESAVDEITLTVPVSCSITSTVGSEHTATIDLGTYEDDIGETTFNVLCNDANGFAVYAIGFSDDDYGNTTMKPSTLAAANGIATGTATSGATSNWAMKLTAVSGTYAPTIATGFNTYHAVPDDYTKVASFASSTDAVSGSSFKSTYAIYISQAQPADTYTGKVKYAVVHPSNATAPEVPTMMQNLSSASCTSTPSQVVDSRDGHSYTVQRLLDGNCWMMENLDLGRTDLTRDLTSTNTNIVTAVPATTFNSWKKTTGSRTSDAGEFIPVSGTDSLSGTPYGTLYNYYVVSAGTISGASNYSDATSDICPAGWRLPTGGPSGEFKALYLKYNSNALMRASIENSGAAFALAGYFFSASPAGQGLSGRYWTSTRITNTNMYYVLLNTSDVGISSSNDRGSGYAVRCILKELTMQDVSSWGSSVQAGGEVLAKDARDGKTYTIARLADGNLWMTQNLDFDIDSTKTYTSADTDIPVDWTPSTSTVTTTAWTNSATAPMSYDPGTKYWNGSTTSGNNSQDYIANSGNSHYHLGNYYNWTAAVAMNDSSSYNTKGSLADQSICPAGWTLPRAGYGDDTFYSLINEYDTWDPGTNTVANNTSFFISPTYFSLSGLWGGSYSFVGNEGDFWSSVASSSSSAYDLRPFHNNDIYPGNYDDNKSVGKSVRCIARPVTSTVSFPD